MTSPFDAFKTLSDNVNNMNNAGMTEQQKAKKKKDSDAAIFAKRKADQDAADAAKNNPINGLWSMFGGTATKKGQ